MYKPSFEEFAELAKQGNMIPVYREILSDVDTPVTAFQKIDSGKFSYLLESVEGGENWGRYSFLGSNPKIVFRSKGKHISITKDGKTEGFETDESPFMCLKKIMRSYQPVPVAGLPRFCGGAVGFSSYDAVRFFEELPDTCEDELDVPDLFYMITDTLLIFDNAKLKIKALCNVLLSDFDSLEAAYAHGCGKVDTLIEQILSPINIKPIPPIEEGTRGKKKGFTSNTSRSQFMKNVEKAKEYIRKGDIFQVVLSQRLSMDIDVEPFVLYRTLRGINPSPYMFYLKFDDITLVGCSPEIMVRLEDDNLTIRPIAGTRPRGKTTKEDEELANDLLADEKECSEHIMLVDLGRNDLGRVSKNGTVVVDRLKYIEKYSHVMHIVSNIVGKLDESYDAFDVLAASFPAGTLSGAPKIRAMEIIDELEVSRRGTYGGAVGYISFSGNMDTCITIRTTLVKDGKAFVQAGAGIVADSDPDKEYEESLNKAQALLTAIREVSGNI